MRPATRLVVSIDHQTLEVHRGGEILRVFDVSTALKGVGFAQGSQRTPTGRFRIAECIGGGEPVGTIFKSRVPVGMWHDGDDGDDDLILTRVLRLDGLEENNANTMERFIYLHGTNREDQIGKPASHGCVRLRNDDIVELFALVEVADEVEILPPSQQRGKLLFIDCDSTLSAIEGIDELARMRGEEVFRGVCALTEQAMNGDIAIHEVFPRRMEMISPDREMSDAVAQSYIRNVIPGAAELIDHALRHGWLPVILSGGFYPLILPLARHLGIAHVEAVPLYFDDGGRYAGYGHDYPTTRNAGKNEVIREWKAAMLPTRVVMIGDGVSDLETCDDVDLFVGFGGVVDRPIVASGCGLHVTSFDDPALIAELS